MTLMKEAVARTAELRKEISDTIFSDWADTSITEAQVTRYTLVAAILLAVRELENLRKLQP